MRPLRLQLDGFGSYRDVTEADFSDVDFFALTGPTGSGKSTLIDGLCFALYGTVPRWGNESAIAQALAPAANACRVCLIFEAGGKRYAAVRALTRDKRGRVHTKEARLDLLPVPPEPGAVDSGAAIADLLGSAMSSLAEGPEDVKGQVQQILGLSYEHFTQSVLLPQGQFAEFLHAKPADRQDLLVELLAFGVYARVGQRAREQAKLAADRAQTAQRERAALPPAATLAADEEQLDATLAGLTALEGTAADLLASLAEVTERATSAAAQASTVRAEVRLLAALAVPPGVPGLAQRIADAEQLVEFRGQQSADTEQAVALAEREGAELPDRTAIETVRAAHLSRRELAEELERQSAAASAAATAAGESSEALDSASRAVQSARDALAAAQDQHAAAHLAAGLTAGGTCPVCLQAVPAVPPPAPPASLSTARAEVHTQEAERTVVLASHDKAVQKAAAARGAVDATRERLSQVSAALATAPDADAADELLRSIVAVEERLRRSRGQAREQRTALQAAEKARAALTGDEQEAWALLRASRDSVVAVGAPAVDGTDLAAAWASLATWGERRLAAARERQEELDEVVAGLAEQVTAGTTALTGLLAAHGIHREEPSPRTPAAQGITEPARVLAAVAARRVQAENELAAVRRDQVRASELDALTARHQEEEQVATMLGNLLRANSFERWLCGEALDTLMTEASQTLMELSGGQYQLERDERNELEVVDFQDAGARRPVSTLSGGETFQASLALALALSRQVVSLSAGLRDLNSMFLDEGFGTLDEDTLEVVASTLEQLAAGSDRMVGVVTHVPALAERVPVRFVVSKAGGTSTIRKERT
ncbi:MAG TPA: SMC family ATPase [Streptosporangiaceae bacterium]|nr:SMC family ATPase [Streptosporangiaceae bacterium]